MIGIGLILTLCLIFVIRGNNSLLKGILIPISLLTIVNLGYGSFLALSRPKHITAATELYQEQASQVIQSELDKAQRDHKNYSNLNPIWAVLIGVSLVSFFLFTLLLREKTWVKKIEKQNDWISVHLFQRNQEE